ncbi:hypothetical protein ACFLRF_04055 [Candidatus Altiarchaeota archaeon]
MLANSRGKGQAFSLEIVISYMIFLVILVMILYLWNMTTREIMEANTQKNINEISIDMAEQLVRTPGNPRNWTADNVSTIGLANESRRLMRGKMVSFMHLMDTVNGSLCSDGDSNYECNRYMMGVMAYDFYINITYLNKSALEIDGTQVVIGRSPVNETELVTVVRAALVNESIVLMHLTVWDD